MKTIQTKPQRMGGLLFALFILCLLNTKTLAAEAGDLDQAANGGVNDIPTNPVDWINGNSNAQKSHFVEGDSIPYRLKLTDLTVGTNYVDIDWDIRESSKAAIDYITSFQRINETVNPLKGLTGTYSSTNTFPIPPPPVSTTSGTPGSLPQPLTSFSSLPASQRNITIYNGVITSIQYINNADGNLGSWSVAKSDQRIRITFNATAAQVVLAWGGHIASRRDWGEGNSASALSGSPYHTRFISLNGQGGNQDRSLAASAVCLPPNCLISGPLGTCTASTQTYTAQTDGIGNTFLWSISGNGTLVGPTTGSSVQVTSGAPGSYTLSVTISRPATSGGCSSTCSQTVTVNGVPSCSISRLNTQQVGVTLYEGPVGMANYSWTVAYNTDPASSAGGNEPSVALADPTVQGTNQLASVTVSLTVQDTNGCISSCAVTFALPGECILTPPPSCPNALQTFTYGGDPTNSTFVWSIETPGSPVSIVGTNTEPSVVVTSPVCAEFVLRLDVTAPDGFVTTCLTTNAFVDNLPPVLLNLPDGGDLGCNPTLPTCSTNVTALDNCDGDISSRVTCNPGLIEETGTCTRSQTFAYSVADSCGNTATASVTYTWKTDTTAPVLGNLPNGGDLGCNPTRPTCSSAVTASDNCDGDLTARVQCVPSEILRNGDCGYSQTFTYSVQDDCLNRVAITVVYTWREDLTPPELSNLPSGGDLGCNPVLPTCSTNVTALDNCDGDLTAGVRCVPGPIVTAELCRKIQLFTYSVEDRCGNSIANVVRYTWTEDTLPPIIVCPTVPLRIECPAVPVFPEATVTDDCDPAPIVTYEEVTTPGGCPQNYTVTRTWTAVDACGNRSTCTASIEVVDTTPPVIVCPIVPPRIECPAVPVFPEVTVNDVCDSNPRVVFEDITTPGTCPLNYSVTRTWTAIDACGNATVCVATIEVVDTTPPRIVCPTVVSPIECPAVPVFPEATASDECDPNPIVSYVDVTTAGNCPQSYSVTRTWTATDACGNPSTCSATIEVRDTTPPLVTWPGNINLTCTDCDIDPANTGSPTGEDLCGTLTITYTDSITGTCPKRVERQWTISDGCNEVSHVQIIQCLPTTRVVVTDSSLCSYDLDPTTPCKDFRLLFTQDAQNFPQHKLHASNPGQTYFNLFYTGLPGAVVTLNLTIPYPYVTQGAQPIHAYDSVTAIPGLNGQECYIPGNGFFVNSTQVVLSDYLPQGMGSSTTVTVTLTVPASGFVYLNMHLDYGLKKTTGYAKGGPSGNDAIDPTTLRVLIPDRGTYSFAFSDGNEAASDSLCNINVFKKVPGVGVMSTQRTTTYDGLPTTRQFEGCGVVLKDSKGLTLATGKTDLDGWAFCNYKWTGKSTTLYVTLTPPGRAPQTQPVTLKANGYAQADFESP